MSPAGGDRQDGRKALVKASIVGSFTSPVDLLTLLGSERNRLHRDTLPGRKLRRVTDCPQGFILVGFPVARVYLGLETTRGWKEKTVLRAAPCLFGLYTVVACLYSRLPRRYARVRAVAWAGKTDVTFSDAITAVRRWLWREWVFAIPGYKPAFEKLSRPFRSLLLHALAPAA